MIRFLFSIILIGILGTDLCHARIGETRDVLTARYGPGKVAGYQIIYSTGNMTVNVFFNTKARSSMEIYAHRVDPKDLPENYTKEDFFAQQADLTADEIDQILKDNADKFAWQSTQSNQGNDFWIRSDGKVVAQYNKGDKALVLKLLN